MALRDRHPSNISNAQGGQPPSAAIAPGAGPAEELACAAALRHGLQALALPLVDESVTFSAGIVACQPHDDTLDSLLRQADDALYEAKAGGRNRSVVAQRGS